MGQFFYFSFPLAQTPLPPSLSHDPQSVELFNIANGYFESGEDTLAINGFHEFIKRYPHHTLTDQAYLFLGQAYSRQLNYHKAIEIFLKSLTSNSKPSLRSPIRRGLIDAYLAVGKHKRAIPLLELELELEGGAQERFELENKLLESYIGTRNYFKAIQILYNRKGSLSEPEGQGLLLDQIRNVMDHGLGEKDLLKIINHFPGQFPSDIAMIKLLALYEFHHDEYREQKILNRFIKEFPEHEFIERALVLKRELEEVLRGKTFSVGALLPLTGPLEPYATSILNGLQLALSSDSSEGEGDIGLYVIDTQGKSQKIHEGFRELIENVHPLAIVGPLLSKEVQEIISKAERFQIPIITPTATRSDLTQMSPFLFRNALTNPMQAHDLAEYALNKLGLKNFVILYPRGRYGTDLARLFAKEVVENGGELIFMESFDPEENDHKPVLRKLKAADLKRYGVQGEVVIPFLPGDENEEKGGVEKERKIEMVYVPGFDAIFLPGTAPQVGLMAPQLAFHNFLGVTLLGTNGWNSEELVKVGGEYIEGSIFIDTFFINYSDPRTGDFVNRYRSRFQEDPDVFAALAFDCGRMILQAIQNGADSGSSLRYALEKMQDFPGVTGLTTAGPDGEMKKKLVFLTVTNGKITQIQ
ncbi:MAG TPA: penicillin-binding protein activator [Nitrospiria bacterium]